MGIPGFTAEKVVVENQEQSYEESKQALHRISVPGLTSEEIGLGDVISRIASKAGISPCGGCRRRAQVLNRWVSFSPRR